MVQTRGGNSSTRPTRSQATRGEPSTRPRRSTQEKGKGVAQSQATTPTGSQAPWPRAPNTPFTERGLLDPSAINRTQLRAQMRSANYISGDSWDRYHSVFYNGWLRIKKIQPSNFVCGQTLAKMGIQEVVQYMFQRAGLGRLPYLTKPLYPDLVRQLYASAEVTYRDIAHPAASEAVFSYFANGVRYTIPIPEFCRLYGFNDSCDGCSFPSTLDYDEYHKLWYLIADGECNTRENRLTAIRNPVLRIVAKIMGHTLFTKSEAGCLSFDEMVLLTYCIPPSARPDYFEPPPVLTVNRGLIFAEKLVEKKFRGIGSKSTVEDQVELQGSLLTPLFEYHGIDLSTAECDDRISLYDESYFRRVRYLKPGFIHCYHDRDGVERFFQLPNLELTKPNTRSNVEFLPPPEF